MEVIFGDTDEPNYIIGKIFFDKSTKNYKVFDGDDVTTDFNNRIEEIKNKIILKEKLKTLINLENNGSRS